MYPPRIHGTWLLSWLLLSRLATTKTVNMTIDDTYGDSLGNAVTYTPVDAWNSRDCTGCSAKPDGNYTYNATWHDSTFNPDASSNSYPNTVLTASTRFSGTAVWVYCVLARTTAFPTGNSDMSFYLDGQYVGAFAKAAPGTDGYDYDVVVYTNTSLSAGFHTLVIQNGHINGNKAITLLDRIVYTHDTDDDEKKKKSTPIGAIVGPVVGGVVLIAFGICAFILCRRRQRRAAGARPIDGFDSDGSETQNVWTSGRNQPASHSDQHPYALTSPGSPGRDHTSSYSPYAHTDNQSTYTGMSLVSPNGNHLQNQSSYATYPSGTDLNTGGPSISGGSTRNLNVLSPAGMSTTVMSPLASPPATGASEEAPPEYQEESTSAGVATTSAAAANGGRPIPRVDQKRTRSHQ